MTFDLVRSIPSHESDGGAFPTLEEAMAAAQALTEPHLDWWPIDGGPPWAPTGTTVAYQSHIAGRRSSFYISVRPGRTP